MTDFKKYNISSPQDLMKYFEENMNYGFVYGKKVYTDSDPNFNFQKEMDRYYKLRLGEDFLKSKYGVCWDFCVLEREFFEQAGIENRCFFMEGFKNREEGGPTHTFALYKQDDKWIWFEYSWLYYRGFREYNSVEEALTDIVEKFKGFYDVKFESVKIFNLPRFDKRVDTCEFVERCLDQNQVTFQEEPELSK